jgi:hypothetical protein
MNACVGEHGRRSLAGKEPPCVDLGDVGHQVGYSPMTLMRMRFGRLPSNSP